MEKNFIQRVFYEKYMIILSLGTFLEISPNFFQISGIF